VKDYIPRCALIVYNCNGERIEESLKSVNRNQRHCRKKSGSFLEYISLQISGVSSRCHISMFIWLAGALLAVRISP